MNIHEFQQLLLKGENKEKKEKTGKLSIDDSMYLERLLKKWGTNYEKMAKDIKLNKMQWTAHQIEKKHHSYLKLFSSEWSQILYKFIQCRNHIVRKSWSRGNKFKPSSWKSSNDIMNSMLILKKNKKNTSFRLLSMLWIALVTIFYLPNNSTKTSIKKYKGIKNV